MSEYKEHKGLYEIYKQVDGMPFTDEGKKHIKEMLLQFGETKEGWRGDTESVLTMIADVTRMQATDADFYSIESDVDYNSVLTSLYWIRRNLYDIINYSLKLKEDEENPQ